MHACHQVTFVHVLMKPGVCVCVLASTAHCLYRCHSMALSLPACHVGAYCCPCIGHCAIVAQSAFVMCVGNRSAAESSSIVGEHVYWPSAASAWGYPWEVNYSVWRELLALLPQRGTTWANGNALHRQFISCRQSRAPTVLDADETCCDVQHCCQALLAGGCGCGSTWLPMGMGVVQRGDLVRHGRALHTAKIRLQWLVPVVTSGCLNRTAALYRLPVFAWILCLASGAQW